MISRKLLRWWCVRVIFLGGATRLRRRQKSAYHLEFPLRHTCSLADLDRGAYGLHETNLIRVVIDEDGIVRVQSPLLEAPGHDVSLGIPRREVGRAQKAGIWSKSRRISAEPEIEIGGAVRVTRDAVDLREELEQAQVAQNLPHRPHQALGADYALDAART